MEFFVSETNLQPAFHDVRPDQPDSPNMNFIGAEWHEIWAFSCQIVASLKLIGTALDIY